MQTISKQLLFFVCTFVFLVLAMGMRLGPELADDGAFFLRYAHNMANGHFWVWNEGESPVWGASAPLYPLLIALPIKLGVPPLSAMIGTGIIVAAMAMSFTALLLALGFGWITGFVFVALAALDTGMMYFSGSGLETPLTIACLSFALWTLLRIEAGYLIGLAAGLLFVHKLDLVPVAGLLLLAHWAKTKKIPLDALIVAGGIAILWYGFAWWYFGAPVPNSFLTKALHQGNQPKIIDWRWFGSFVFIGGFHLWLTVAGVAGSIALIKKQAPLILFLLGLLFVHTAAYTVKFPFEPYNWYCMPSIFALLVLGAIGIGAIQIPCKNFSLRSSLGLIIPIAILSLIYATSAKTERQIRNSIISFSANQEFDRSEAGRWVAENTPVNFKVFTLWGNPAYYSNREIIDASFLNRHYEPGNLIEKYNPEILILQNNPGSTPMDPVFAFPGSERYKIIRTFDRTYSHNMDYFFSVLARTDVTSQITNVEPPRNLMRYVDNLRLGDQFGINKPINRYTLFIHPGASTPTEFDFNISSFSADLGKSSVTINARMADNIPPEAVERGAAVLKLTIYAKDEKLAEAVVDTYTPFSLKIPATAGDILHVTVDNNGSADTDWLWLSID